MALAEQKTELQQEAVRLFNSLGDVKNSPQEQVRGVNVAPGLRIVEAFAGLPDVESLPPGLTRLFGFEPTGVAMHLRVGDSGERVNFGISLSPLPMKEGASLYISNEPSVGITRQNEFGESIDAPIMEEQTVREAVEWVSGVINLHK